MFIWRFIAWSRKGGTVRLGPCVGSRGMNRTAPEGPGTDEAPGSGISELRRPRAVLVFRQTARDRRSHRMVGAVVVGSREHDHLAKAGRHDRPVRPAFAELDHTLDVGTGETEALLLLEGRLVPVGAVRRLDPAIPGIDNAGLLRGPHALGDELKGRSECIAPREGLAVHVEVAVHVVIRIPEFLAFVVLAEGHQVAALLEPEPRPEIAILIRVAEVAPLVLEPAGALETNRAACHFEFALRGHVRRWVIEGQAVHRFRVLALLRIDPDAFQTPIGHRRIAWCLGLRCHREAERLVPFARLRRVAGEGPRLGGMFVGGGESALAVVDLVAEVEVLRVRARAFGGHRPGDVEQRSMEFAGVEVVEGEQHIVQRPTLFGDPTLAERHPEHRDTLACVEIPTKNRDVMPLVEVVALIEIAAMPGMVAGQRIDRLPAGRFDARTLEGRLSILGARRTGRGGERTSKGPGP